VAYALYLVLFRDEKCVPEILAEAIGNADFSYAELQEFVTCRGFDGMEYKYRVLGLLLDVLVEQIEWEKLCGVRKPDQYLRHAYLSCPVDPCYDCACVGMARSDRCGQARDCVFFCVCEDWQQVCYLDV
jgi:hypothetical protein